MKVYKFTEAKNPGHNEDALAYNSRAFVLIDGSTSVTDYKFGERTGGEVAADILSKTALNSHKTGVPLVQELNAALHQFYRENNALEATQDPANRSTACFAHAVVNGNELTITRVGEVGFRFNGELNYLDKEIDIWHAKLRSAHYHAHGDLKAARAFIVPLIREGFEYQNKAEHPYGYGAIDGYITPERFVEVYTFPVKKGSTLELFSDGYVVAPEKPSIEAWETEYKRMMDEDPERVGRYPATKPLDDRSVLIVHFE